LAENEPTNAAGQTVDEGAPKDATPPFTEGVPNPPVGIEAEERLERNVAAAEQRGDKAAAEGYEKQAEDAKEVSAYGGDKDVPGQPPNDGAGQAVPS
jgi:hypothetical protein